jgi:hypothetical protein
MENVFDHTDSDSSAAPIHPESLHTWNIQYLLYFGRNEHVLGS